MATWEDRLREAAYTSPGGTRFVFIYDDVSQRVTKKTTEFTFPAFDGSFIQDLGPTGDNYPFRFVFSGADYDLESTAFLTALKEIGRGVLEHPIYRRKDVVPFGQIVRRDELKTAANQAIFELVFYESSDLVFPVSATEIFSLAEQAILNYDNEQAEQFASELELTNAEETVSYKQRIKDAIAAVKNALRVIAEVQEDIKREFEDAIELINESIDVLIGTPLQLVADIIDLIRLPGRALASIEAKLDAYNNLFNSLIGAESDNFEPSYDKQPNNAFLTKNLFAAATVSTMLLDSLNVAKQTGTDTTIATTPTLSIAADTQPPFLSKPQIIETVDFINNRFDEFLSWSDNNRIALDMIDTGEAYAFLQSGLALGLGDLIFFSFTARQEIVFTLDRDRTPHDLVAELYQTIDPVLDFFAMTNNLSGDELFEIKKGRKIVYYQS
jgi:hypothetical protein